MTNMDGCQLTMCTKICDRHRQTTSQIIHAVYQNTIGTSVEPLRKEMVEAGILSLCARAGRHRRHRLAAKNFSPAIPFESGDLVWVRSREEIDATLDPFKELKGCAFLPDMYQYCDTQQRVLKSMQYFIDERDYKRKKVRGVILLEDVICNGTPAFGACDRCCFLFWREEWLKRVING